MWAQVGPMPALWHVLFVSWRNDKWERLLPYVRRAAVLLRSGVKDIDNWERRLVMSKSLIAILFIFGFLAIFAMVAFIGDQIVKGIRHK